MTTLREAAQQAEKLDPIIDRLWSQLRYAYEHGSGHSGHLNNAWHTAMMLSKELKRLVQESKRKPLTEEEILLISIKCAASHQRDDVYFVRAIERAHGIADNN